MSRSWAKHGTTAHWRRLRRAILAANQLENGGRCTLHIPGVCTGQATEVHHVHGRRVTGDDPRWLQPVCRACNLHVGDPQRLPDPPGRGMTQW